MINNMKKIIRLSLALLALGFVSCEKELPSQVEQPYETEISAISIVNAGADGATVMEGRIDEENKMIDFKRIAPETDFSQLKVKATLSDGAVLENDVFDFSMDEETTEKTLVLRIKNHNRYKDYFIRVRKKVPVFGADWEQVKTYGFCASTNNTYEHFNSASTRWASFDGEYVLVVSRKGGTNPHLLKVSDLKEGNINPLMLNNEGVTGGTFPICCGAVINGRTYINNLSGGGKWSPLKIYYYETPASAPEVILNLTLDTIEGANTRHGDNVSFNLDEKGDGYVYFGSNNAADVLRFTIKNWKEIDPASAVVLGSATGANSYPTINRIWGTDNYIFSGINMGPQIVDESLSVQYSLKSTSVPSQSTASRIISFNEERYLVTVTAGRTEDVTPTMNVYDITKGGDSLTDCLARFESGDRKPVYTFIIGGGKSTSPGTNIDYYIEKDADGKDSKLYLFAARCDSGFAICEFPIKVALDD